MSHSIAERILGVMMHNNQALFDLHSEVSSSLPDVDQSDSPRVDQVLELEKCLFTLVNYLVLTD